MFRENRDYQISLLPKTESGQAYFSRLAEMIAEIEHKEEYGSKICNDPLIEDFRVQLGIKIGLKRAMREPHECLQRINKGG